MGMHDKNGQRQGNPKRYQLDRVVKHPNWYPNGFYKDGDFALLKVSDSVELNEYTKTIPMAEEGDKFDGKCCFVSGWGAWDGRTLASPDILQKLKVTVKSEENYCRPKGFTKGDWHVCIFQPPRASCKGDSGGPMSCKKNGRWVLAGATSYGFSEGNSWCSTNSFPSVYSSVAYHRRWIRQVSGV